MPKYVIEREIPEVGSSSLEQLQDGSRKSCATLGELGTSIQWIQSYITADKAYCVYIAPDEDIIREHAQRTGIPANRISRVSAVTEPTTAE